jgi:predicted short-subunit dehydrogenase-like oxidoreductase (DUF2520 family)
MRLGLIGGGRAARTLEPRLREAGHEIGWWWSRASPESIESLPPVEVVLLAVTDNAISEIAASLSTRDASGEEVWLHLSGARPPGDARVSPDRPRAVGTFHPMVALPGDGAPKDLLAGTTCGVGGDPMAAEHAATLARSLGMTAIEISDDQRPLYHAAAVSVAGHAIALLHQASEMLQRTGFNEAQARRALAALMASALRNLQDGSPAEIITGPIARGDSATVRLHLEALSSTDDHTLATYIHLASTALDLSAPDLSPECVTIIQQDLDNYRPTSP